MSLLKIPRAAFTTRASLLAGFGCMALLIGFTGADTIDVTHRVLEQEQNVRWKHEHRGRRLDQIRDDLNQSGTYIRDYLMDPQSANSEANRASLYAARQRTEAHIVDYQAGLSPEERELFRNLKQQLDAYWSAFDPIFAWTAAQRQEHGSAFLRDEVVPRRQAMLEVAAHIAQANDALFDAGSESVRRIFAAFRSRVLVSLVIALGLGILLAILTIRRILGLEQAQARQLEETRRACYGLRELSESLVRTQEHERRLISRELTESVAQTLCVILLRLEDLVKGLPPEFEDGICADARVLRSVTETTVSEVNDLSSQLYPDLLDNLGLVAALEWQARAVEQRTGLPVSVTASGIPRDLPADVRVCAFRIVEETLARAAQLGRTGRVEITLRLEDEHLLLTLNHGCGPARTEREKLVAFGFEERVARLGGSMRGMARAERDVTTVSFPVGALPRPRRAC